MEIAPAKSKWRCAELCAAFPEQPGGQRNSCDADGHVDEEDPRPAERRREQAAEQNTGGSTASRCGAVDAERGVPLTPVREGRHQQREGSGSEQRSSKTLDGPERDERAFRPGQAAEQGADREDGEPGYEQSPAAQEVGKPTTEEQRPAEHDRVRRDHPLQARLREAEIQLDRGQRHVHDRNVEDDHELRRDDECKRAPTSPRVSAVACE